MFDDEFTEVDGREPPHSQPSIPIISFHRAFLPEILSCIFGLVDELSSLKHLSLTSKDFHYEASRFLWHKFLWRREPRDKTLPLKLFSGNNSARANHVRELQVSLRYFRASNHSDTDEERLDGVENTTEDWEGFIGQLSDIFKLLPNVQTLQLPKYDNRIGEAYPSRCAWEEVLSLACLNYLRGPLITLRAGLCIQSLIPILRSHDQIHTLEVSGHNESEDEEETSTVLVSPKTLPNLRQLIAPPQIVYALARCNSPLMRVDFALNEFPETPNQLEGSNIHCITYGYSGTARVHSTAFLRTFRPSKNLAYLGIRHSDYTEDTSVSTSIQMILWSLLQELKQFQNLREFIFIFLGDADDSFLNSIATITAHILKQQPSYWPSCLETISVQVYLDGNGDDRATTLLFERRAQGEWTFMRDGMKWPAIDVPDHDTFD